MRRVSKYVLGAVAAIALAVVLAGLAFPLPDASVRGPSDALPADPATRLGQRTAEAAVDHPGLSGVRALSDGHDALASRLALIDRAQGSIDAQYYIWQEDTSGVLLLGALQRAAKRGVRVRLLLDDNGVSGMDSHLAALHDLENVEVRLFNPSTVRRPKLAGYAFDFFRMNRRMHNKSLLVDGAVAIVGGRNIGDEYFEVGDDAWYVDLDVLVVGAAVPETAAVFDAYWNSESAFPVDSIVAGSGDSAAFDADVARIRASPEAEALVAGFQSTAERYAREAQALEWTSVVLLADDPVKALGTATPDQLMARRMAEILMGAEDRLDLVSAYFVPGPQGSALLGGLARSGNQVRILTNAMRTTDVLLVHAGYMKYRSGLLEAGATLYELEPGAAAPDGPERQILPFGVSGASLHAKTFAVDGERLFVGSFNFDPRSVRLNCEMGFLIDSPTLAGRIAEAFDGPLPGIAYRPALTSEGNTIWNETLDDGSVVTHSSEPGATWRERLAIALVGVLPVEWLL